MDFEKWISNYHVRAFPWVDGKNIYMNVQYFRRGQSISRSPAWEKTVYIFDDEAGRKLVSCFTSSLVNAICSDRIKNNSHIKVEKLPFNQ